MNFGSRENNWTRCIKIKKYWPTNLMTWKIKIYRFKAATLILWVPSKTFLLPMSNKCLKPENRLPGVSRSKSRLKAIKNQIKEK